LDFVNTQLPYPYYEAREGATHEAPKYPLEALVEGGNCSSKAILGASLMHAVGLEVALISYPEHVAIGVAGSFQGKDSRFYDFEGTRYYFAEAAGGPYQAGTRAPKIGEMPDKYFKNADVFPLK